MKLFLVHMADGIREDGYLLPYNGDTGDRLYGVIKTDEPRTLDFSWVRGFLVTNVCIVQRSAA